MMKKLIGIFICMLLIVTILPVSANLIIDKTYNSTMFGNTLFVGGTGPNNYSKIQDAINYAHNGDSIFVFNISSPYIENIIVNKSINLIGENKNSTIIDGNKSGDVFNVVSDGVFISDFTIMNGIYDNSNDIRSGVNISSNYTTISNNIIINNFIGITITNGVGNTISDNIISSNNVWGIDLETSKNNSIMNNSIVNDNFIGILANGACNNLISGNEISDNDNGIDLFGIIYLDNNLTKIHFYGSNHNKICFNNITNNRLRGIQIIDSKNNNIFQNNFIGNRLGIAKFLFFILDVGYNKWDGNYWNTARKNPFFILGKIDIITGVGIIPWINIDWHPALKPYDIGV